MGLTVGLAAGFLASLAAAVTFGILWRNEQEKAAAAAAECERQKKRASSVPRRRFEKGVHAELEGALLQLQAMTVAAAYLLKRGSCSGEDAIWRARYALILGLRLQNLSVEEISGMLGDRSEVYVRVVLRHLVAKGLLSEELAAHRPPLPATADGQPARTLADPELSTFDLHDVPAGRLNTEWNRRLFGTGEADATQRE